ncbi:MAG: cyclase family protein [Anaerolineae bacterium]
MCSRDVAHAVRARIDKDGLPNLSRRGFLRLGGLTAAGAAVASLSTSAVLARASQHSGEVIDLSHVFGTQIPTYLPNEKPQRSNFVTVENDGFFIQNWAFGEHAGTHVDIPAHFIADAVTVDNFPVTGLVGPAVVIDISAKAAMMDDATLDVEDIEAWEAANGRIPDGAFVLMHSGWDARWPDQETFRNADADGVQHYPGFSAEAATFLVEQRSIHGIGVDTLSLDIGASATFDVHYIILGAGLIGVECVANLSAIKDKAATVVVGVPRWEGGSGGPARVIALV